MQREGAAGTSLISSLTLTPPSRNPQPHWSPHMPPETQIQAQNLCGEFQKQSIWHRKREDSYQTAESGCKCPILYSNGKLIGWKLFQRSLEPYHVLQTRPPKNYLFLWIWSGSRHNSLRTSNLTVGWIWGTLNRHPTDSLTLLTAQLHFFPMSCTWHGHPLNLLKKVKCSSDTQLFKYKGKKNLSCPQKCPKENLKHGINLVLYKYSAMCFLLHIKNSWPSVIDKEPISFYLSKVLKGEEVVTEGK